MSCCFGNKGEEADVVETQRGSGAEFEPVALQPALDGKRALIIGIKYVCVFLSPFALLFSRTLFFSIG